ncbi:uncharacterized protein LOC127239373 [Andrographis paniculata]|uniref:uncharacterized protein LOC127239373 n=1 Tax=Andrographis paniculata TaxID=175694 RepID=UPI0021E87C9F|nr:uncharacterized protein LOC127239373 [Andrographis paniculata]XP_051113441.1 uncharacterized protein LOC127239373 [Andrographis paniculata]XP_051113442.1 uncharacterized protein LOC127239373 [Andrographis paniculata]
MQNMLDQVLFRITLHLSTPLTLSLSRFQATFLGPTFAEPSYVDSTIPSATASNRADRGNTPLTFPNNVPFGPRIDNTQPNITREDRQGGHIHDPIYIPDHQHLRLDPEEIAHVLRVHFGMNPHVANRLVYQRPFSEMIINDYLLPRNYRPSDFYTFSREDGSSTIEHVVRFTAQLGVIGSRRISCAVYRKSAFVERAMSHNH